VIPLDEYDIGKAFGRIEEELIKSMIRNLDHHKAEEDKEGIQWSQWQVEQLRALEEYKKENKEKFSGDFADVNSSIDELIKMARKEGGMEQEEEILKAIKNGAKLKKGKGDIEGEFFKVNDRKMNALAKATKNDFQKAEVAMLRRANDQYRKVIFSAQVYANAGGTTYEKAVDMATKDFIAKGIDCIEYKDGSRHTIKDYADMAIKTATKRAYLTGEGEKRQEWGISTVIMNKRGNPCPKCLPFVGKILIDDVWSGGNKKEGDYPLMSTAIAAGLYHPRCKDSHTTYFPGISTPPDDKFSKKEVKEIEKESKKEAKQQYAKRQEEKYDRLAKYSLDEENKKQYQKKATKWANYEVDEGTESDRVAKYLGDETEKSLDAKSNNSDIIENINEKATESLLQSYEERRIRYGLNETPADELRKSSLNPVVADYTGVSGKTAKEFSEVIEKLSSQYNTGLTKIRVADKKETFGAKFFATTRHQNSIGVKELIINPHKMNDYDKMVERISELSKTGYCIKMPDDKIGEYVATHEFAHGLIDMESPLKNYIGMDTKQFAKIRKEIKGIYNEYMDEISTIEDKIKELKKDKAFFDFNTSAEEQFAAFKRLEDAQNELATVKLSRYSMENADEFMAEAFAQTKIGSEKGKYSDRVMEVLDKHFGKSVAKTSDSDIIEMYRKGSTYRKISKSGNQIIDKATYNKITKPAIKKGADIRIAEGEILERLNKVQATAVTYGKTIFFREDATVSDVLEEVHHFYQNKKGLNLKYGHKQRTILNEIDAKEYLCSVADKYKIPKEEITVTEKQLESYKKEMEELKKRGEWID
jgi:hypothetical protein